MSKYIKKLELVGDCLVNTKLIIKDWNDRFLITFYNSSIEKKYTFIINSKRKDTYNCKVQISETQAMEIINSLKLVLVKDSLFKNSGIFRDKSYVKSQIFKYKELLKEKRMELDILSSVLTEHELSLE